MKEFISACEAGELDQLIDVCLQQLRIEGGAATEVSLYCLCLTTPCDDNEL